MSLIEKEPIMKFIEDGLNNKHYGHVGVEIITEVEYAPTIDAVQVIRCKDCFYANPFFGGNYVRCAVWGTNIRKDGYCHCGNGRKVDSNATD